MEVPGARKSSACGPGAYEAKLPRPAQEHSSHEKQRSVPHSRCVLHSPNATTGTLLSHSSTQSSSFRKRSVGPGKRKLLRRPIAMSAVLDADEESAEEEIVVAVCSLPELADGVSSRTEKIDERGLKGKEDRLVDQDLLASCSPSVSPNLSTRERPFEIAAPATEQLWSTSGHRGNGQSVLGSQGQSHLNQGLRQHSPVTEVPQPQSAAKPLEDPSVTSRESMGHISQLAVGMDMSAARTSPHMNIATPLHSVGAVRLSSSPETPQGYLFKVTGVPDMEFRSEQIPLDLHKSGSDRPVFPVSAFLHKMPSKHAKPVPSLPQLPIQIRADSGHMSHAHIRPSESEAHQGGGSTGSRSTEGRYSCPSCPKKSNRWLIIEKHMEIKHSMKLPARKKGDFQFLQG